MWVIIWETHLNRIWNFSHTRNQTFRICFWLSYNMIDMCLFYCTMSCSCGKHQLQHCLGNSHSPKSWSSLQLDVFVGMEKRWSLVDLLLKYSKDSSVCWVSLTITMFFSSWGCVAMYLHVHDLTMVHDESIPATYHQHHQLHLFTVGSQHQSTSLNAKQNQIQQNDKHHAMHEPTWSGLGDFFQFFANKNKHQEFVREPYQEHMELLRSK